jgi:GNAT superfamily N-acetyltransferase
MLRLPFDSRHGIRRCRQGQEPDQGRHDPNEGEDRSAQDSGCAAQTEILERERLMAYEIREVAGRDNEPAIRAFNRLFPAQFEDLERRHIESGYWWLVHGAGQIVGFAGLTQFTPFPGIGYLKRAAVLPEHRGRGLQSRLIEIRIEKAKSIGWTHIVSSCEISNISSANNFIRSGFVLCRPERPWEKDSLFWIKEIK